jgi:hypothetical protein
MNSVRVAVSVNSVSYHIDSALGLVAKTILWDLSYSTSIALICIVTFFCRFHYFCRHPPPIMIIIIS